MANAISTLSSSSGCKVIVDDMGLTSGDPWFEDGVISQAIYNFQSNGGTYISSAGNDGNKMYSGQPSIKVGGRKNWVLFTATDSALTFNISDYKTLRIAMQWDDAWGNSSNDYNLYLYDDNWNLVDSSTNYQAGSGSLPQEWFDLTYSNYLNNRTFHIMVDYVGYYTGKPLKNIKVLVLPNDGNSNGSPSFTLTNGSSSGHIVGHAAATNVISVAAYSALDQTPSVETFSSRGPSLMFTAGNPANEQSRNTPVITATDGVVTKVGKDGYFGGDSLFFGTSASAPHVAAIAALYFSRYPTHTSAQFTSAITSSAKYISTGTGGTWNSTSGYGKISAYDAIVKGLTTLNNPQVTSNTTWDLNRITGTANISAGKSVTIDANYTTLVEGTINLGDANSKILVYGTLILSSTASVNPASGLITEPGGRIVSPNMVNISVTQLDESSTPFGTVGHWTFNRFDSAAVPYVFPSFNNTPERMRGQQYFKTGTTQKFQLWNSLSSRVINPDTFKTAVGQPNIITSQFKTANNATLQASLEGVTPGGTLNLLDPWMIDTTDAYGQRNQGMADWYRPISYSSNNLGTGTSHMGMLLNRNVADSVYYSVRAPLTQTINGFTGYFQNWSGTYFTLQQVGNNPSGYDQKAVIFNNANAVVTANYKGIHLSSTSTAFANNSQRKFVRTTNGNLHLVYESMGHVFYEISTNGGITWTLANNGKPLDVNGGKLPAMDSRGNDVAIVWQEKDEGAAALKVALFSGYLMRQYYPLIVFADGSQSYSQNLNPVIAYDYEGRATIAWENKANYTFPVGIVVKHGPLGWYPSSPPNWTTDYASAIPSTNSNCVNPTISAAKNPSEQYTMVYNLAWQYNQSTSNSSLNFCKITANSGGVIVSSISTPSTGSGFWQNYNPSIVSMNDNTARLTWLGYAPWYGWRTVYNYNNTSGTWSSSILNMGSNVLKSHINSTDDGKFVIGWVQNNPFTNRLVKSDNIYTIKNFSTTGNNLQINNASSYSTMYAMAFQNQTVPYSFSLAYLPTLLKTNSLTVSKGRAEVITHKGTDYCFGIGDIVADGQSIDFVSLNSLKTLPNEDTLNYFLRTDDFDITDNSNITFSLFHGMINSQDTTQVINSLSTLTHKFGDVLFIKQLG